MSTHARTTRETVEAIKAAAFADLRDHALTLKQEKFVHAYLETGNATESYRRAYNCELMGAKSIETEALRLLKHPGIALGIERFRRSKFAETLITFEQHMAELKELRDIAKANGQLSAAIRSEELRGRLCGFYVEKVERGNAGGEFANMTDAELRTFIIEECKALGIHVGPVTRSKRESSKPPETI